MFSFAANYLEPICYLIYAIVLFDRYRISGTVTNGILLCYYIFSASLLFLSSYLSKHDVDNNWTYNLFFLATIVTLSWYFIRLLVKPANKWLVKILLGINVFIFLRYVVLSNKFFGVYNSEVFGFSFLSVVIYSILYINQLMLNIREGNILIKFDFWLVFSYLLYFLGGFFVVLFYYNSSILQRAIIWTLLNVILLVSSLIAFAANYKIRRYEKSQKWQT